MLDLDVTGKKTVEEMDVGGFQPGEVLKLFEGRVLEVEDLES